jgi:hypothetical protein
LACSAAGDYRKVSFSIVRPPRLLTDFSDGPQRTDAVAPELVAVDVVRHLLEPAKPGEIVFVERFAGAGATPLENPT